jgi:AmmeMemoRadiSam system protein A
MNPKDILNGDDQRILLDLARSSVREALETRKRPKPVEVLSPVLRAKRGVFVTLHMEGALRGCIGFPFPVKPLAEACQEAAVSAAFEDTRFPPVESEELQHIEFEISALSPPEPIQPDKIKVGIHGLIVRKGKRSGLLLPQVALEYHWNAEEFLRQTCRKAGLPLDAWRDGAELSGFEAQVFGEMDFKRRSE